VKDGWASRYWDCCKPHCGWASQATSDGDEPVNNCSQNNQIIGDNTQSACNGGSSFMCTSMAPWEVSSDLSYGYAAIADNSQACGSCYKIEFTGQTSNDPHDVGSTLLGGKVMIVQVTNIGYDVSGGQIDLLIPGGGVGAFDACSQQWGTSDLGAQYGGFRAECNSAGSHSAIKECVRNKCNSVFASFPDLKSGCLWYVDWLEAANNPALKYQPVDCPAELASNAGTGAPRSEVACF
jgi:hypothetical protein